jgi:hypothetical protein
MNAALHAHLGLMKVPADQLAHQVALARKAAAEGDHFYQELIVLNREHGQGKRIKGWTNYVQWI